MLLLDVGNTRCKWAYVEEGSILRKGAVGSDELLSLQSAFAELPQPKRIIVSNVGGEERAARLSVLFSHWQVAAEFIVPTMEACGVRNTYSEPSQLGSDRWAALIAARHQVNDACLVVNCGTATTVDALSAKGEFLGGIIVPGITMMAESLKRDTAQLQDTSGTLQAFPRNTADAIYSGIVRATLGAIEQQYESLSLYHGGAVKCVLSGGAAMQVYPHLKVSAECVEDLVLEGVRLIGEINK